MILLADLENQLFSIALYSDEGRKEYRVVGRYPEYRHNGISAMVVWPESPENVAALNTALDGKKEDQEE